MADNDDMYVVIFPTVSIGREYYQTNWFPSHQEATEAVIDDDNSNIIRSLALGYLFKREQWIQRNLLANLQFQENADKNELEDMGVEIRDIDILNNEISIPNDFDFFNGDDKRYHVIDEFVYLAQNRKQKVDFKQLPEQVIDNLNVLPDVFERDEFALFFNTQEENPPYAVVAFQDGIYRGHVYCWDVLVDDNTVVMNVMGIRSSVYHMLFRPQPRYSLPLFLFTAIKQLTIQLYPDKTSYIRIIRPFDNMVDLSERIGMKPEDTFAGLNPTLNWTKPNVEDSDLPLHERYIGDVRVTLADDDELLYMSGNMIIDTKDSFVGEPNFHVNIVTKAPKTINSEPDDIVFSSSFAI